MPGALPERRCRLSASQQSYEKILENIKNTPVWNVCNSYGRFLTFEIGAPHLFIKEPSNVNSVHSKKVADRLKKRLVAAEGEWRRASGHSPASSALR